MSKKQFIYKILKDYQAGEIGKYEVMDALELSGVHELFALLAEYKVDTVSSAVTHTPADAAPLEDYFKNG